MLKKIDDLNLSREILVCECHSLEHQVAIWYDKEYNEIRIEPHLTTNKNFLQRLVHGIKYIFGYKTVYGSWDDMIIKQEDYEGLANIFKEANIKYRKEVLKNVNWKVDVNKRK